MNKYFEKNLKFLKKYIITRIIFLTIDFNSIMIENIIKML